MEDKTIDIIKNNKYFIRSPFKGKIKSIETRNGQHIEKDDLIALIEYDDNLIFSIRSEYNGTVERINAQVNNNVKKWDSIATITLDGIDERVSFVDDIRGEFLKPQRDDYMILYDFQQTILPTFVYQQKDAFLLCVAEDKDIVYELLNNFYKIRNREIAFRPSDITTETEVINENIILVEINCPKIDGVLLADRIFVVAHTKYPKIQYFTMEESFGGKIMLSTIIRRNNKLSRSNYGPVQNNREIQKRRVLDIFLNR